MGFWGTLGKAALNIAPYAAAPFTGGASLLAAPAANKLGQKIGGNNTMIDKIGGAASGMAGGFGMGNILGKMGGAGTPPFAGGTPPFVPNPQQGGGISPFLQGIMPGEHDAMPGGGMMGNGLSGLLGLLMNRGGGNNRNQSPQYGQSPLNNEEWMKANPRGAGRGPSMGLGPRFDSHNPDLSVPLMAGKQQAQMDRYPAPVSNTMPIGPRPRYLEGVM